MRVQLRVDSDDPEVTHSLLAWLREDLSVRHGGDLRRDATPVAGQMGAVEVLSLVVGSGLSAAQLVVMIAQWRASRHPRPTVTISRTDTLGHTIQIQTSDPEVLAEAVRALEAP